VSGNLIGTDITGTNALSNFVGIGIQSGSNNVVGGLTPGSRNIIGGNSYGVDLSANGTKVLGNYIGLGRDGQTVVSNTTGIFLFLCSETQIGGSNPGARNVICGNLDACHLLQSAGNRIQGNYIGTDASG